MTRRCRASPLAPAFVVLGLAAALPAAAQGSNCEALRDSIAAKFRAGGLTQPRLQIVDSRDATAGKVVGTCAQGSRKIVHLPERPATRKADDAILTECRDGSVSMGGNCGRR